MLSFQSFNILPSTHNFVGRATMQKGKRNRVVVKLTPPIFPQSEEINGRYSNLTSDQTNGHYSNLKSDQTNVVGILGGYSSLNFAKKLVEQEIELPFILCTDPSLTNGLFSLGRSSAGFLSGKPEKVQIDQRLIVENLRRKRGFLEKSGVCCIVMPCHVSHYWYDEIKEGCSVPFLHMGESVAKELKEEKLRPMETGSDVCIGVLASDTRLVTRMYQEKFENEGFKVVMPDKNTMKHIVVPAVEALSMNDFEGAHNLVRIALQVLLIRSVNRIVLACDELRELLPPHDPLWRKCVDPTDALARSAIEYARSHATAENNRSPDRLHKQVEPRTPLDVPILQSGCQLTTTTH